MSSNLLNTQRNMQKPRLPSARTTYSQQKGKTLSNQTIFNRTFHERNPSSNQIKAEASTSRDMSSFDTPSEQETRRALAWEEAKKPVIVSQKQKEYSTKGYERLKNLEERTRQKLVSISEKEKLLDEKLINISKLERKLEENLQNSKNNTPNKRASLENSNKGLSKKQSEAIIYKNTPNKRISIEKNKSLVKKEQSIDGVWDFAKVALLVKVQRVFREVVRIKRVEHNKDLRIIRDLRGWEVIGKNSQGGFDKRIRTDRFIVFLNNNKNQLTFMALILKPIIKTFDLVIDAKDNFNLFQETQTLKGIVEEIMAHIGLLNMRILTVAKGLEKNPIYLSAGTKNLKITFRTLNMCEMTLDQTVVNVGGNRPRTIENTGSPRASGKKVTEETDKDKPIMENSNQYKNLERNLPNNTQAQAMATQGVKDKPKFMIKSNKKTPNPNTIEGKPENTKESKEPMQNNEKNTKKTEKHPNIQIYTPEEQRVKNIFFFTRVK